MKIYYNSACPVCRAGIAKQQRDMAHCQIETTWNDVHRDAAEITAMGYQLEAVRERLHVLDDAGHMHIGADAFAQLFRHTPRRRWLGHVLQLPGLRTLSTVIYNALARRLYRENRRRGRW